MQREVAAIERTRTARRRLNSLYESLTAKRTRSAPRPSTAVFFALQIGQESDMAKIRDLFDEPEAGAAPAKAGSGKSYTAKDIEVLEGLEPVRRRPGMYIGGTGERALPHLGAEIMGNAMDGAVAGHANRIEIELKTDDILIVRDNGRGIPVDPHPKFKNKSALEVIMTTLHAGGKFGGKVYDTSGGLHGVGASVV